MGVYSGAYIWTVQRNKKRQNLLDKIIISLLPLTSQYTQYVLFSAVYILPVICCTCGEVVTSCCFPWDFPRYISHTVILVKGRFIFLLSTNVSFIEYWSQTLKTCIWLVHKSGLRYLRAWKPVGGGAPHHEIHPSALHPGQSGHLKRAGMGIKPNLLPASLPPLFLLSYPANQQVSLFILCHLFVLQS